LIVNKSSYKTKYRVISDLVKAIESSVAHGEGASA